MLDLHRKESILGETKGISIPKSELLTFNLSAPVDETIRLAKRNVDMLVQDVQMNSFTFDKFGKEDIKALKFSPDSFIQIAIQMAFIRYEYRLFFCIFLINLLLIGYMDILPPTMNLLPLEDFMEDEQKLFEVVYQRL